MTYIESTLAPSTLIGGIDKFVVNRQSIERNSYTEHVLFITEKALQRSRTCKCVASSRLRSEDARTHANETRLQPTHNAIKSIDNSGMAISRH